MSLEYASFPEVLRSSIPGFDEVCAEHLEDYDEYLPHVLLGALTRFLLQNASRSDTARREVMDVAVGLLEAALGSSDEKLRELVVVSFLENLEPGELTDVIRASFGPNLMREWRSIFENAYYPARY